MQIKVTAETALPDAVHGVPKCVTPHPNGKLYYVDINKDSCSYLVAYDPAAKTARHVASPDGSDKEKITALGLNHDGSLIVARQTGIYAFDPKAGGEESQQWRKLCDIPLGSNERPNNGVMIPTGERDMNGDSRVQFLLGTGAITPSADATVGKLYALREINGAFSLQELARDMVMVNAVSGQLVDGKPVITFADSYETNATLSTARYLPVAGKLQNVTTLKDFKEGQPKAPNGRPDGTSPVLYNGDPAVAVAAIDTPQIRVFRLSDGEQLATFDLPEGASKPTMATFATEGNKTVAYISTLKTSNTDEVGGKIYKVDAGLEAFTPLPAIGTYSALNPSALKGVRAGLDSAKGRS